MFSKSSFKHETPYSTKEVVAKLEKSPENKEQNKRRKRPSDRKMTISSITHSYPTTVRSLRLFAEKEMQKALDSAKDAKPGQVEPEFILELTKDIHRLGEKRASEYIFRNKTILLSDYALKIKQQDMYRMKDLTESFEELVAKEEEKLERDALNFNEFIKNMNTVTATSMERAVKETKLRMEKMEEVKEVNANIFLLKSNIAKLERFLSECLLSARFLKATTPQKQQWKEDRITKEASNIVGGANDDLSEYTLETVMQGEKSLNPIEVPFKDASELLKSISRFRDQNLNIITNSHYLRNSLKDAEKTFDSVNKKMKSDLDTYLRQIADLEKNIKDNEETAKRLQLLSSISSSVSTTQEKQFEETLAPLVASTYELCTGIKGGKINIMMMVTAIESFLLHLLFDIERLPEKLIMKVYKRKQIERKIQKRKDEEERRAKAQEERLKMLDLRRFDSPKVKLTRRLMYQPEPAKQILKKKEILKGALEDSEEDYDYFFS